MPSNMENEEILPTPSSEMDVFQREENCVRAIKSVVRACLMRVVVGVILLVVMLLNDLNVWVEWMLLLVFLIAQSAMIPLLAELKRRVLELQELRNYEE